VGAAEMPSRAQDEGPTVEIVMFHRITFAAMLTLLVGCTSRPTSTTTAPTEDQSAGAIKVSVEARALVGDVNLLRSTGLQLDLSSPEHVYALDDSQVSLILRFGKAERRDATLIAPRLIINNGQTASGLVLEPDNLDGSEAGDGKPPWAIALAGRADVASDRRGVDLALVATMIHAPGAERSPVILWAKPASLKANLPDRGTGLAILALPGDPPPRKPPANAGAAANSATSTMRVLILFRPTIIMLNEQAADLFPGLDQPQKP
jgi:hypothetical protein